MLKTKLRINRTTGEVATSISLLERKDRREATQEETEYYTAPIDSELIEFGNKFLGVDYHTGKKIKSTKIGQTNMQSVY